MFALWLILACGSSDPAAAEGASAGTPTAIEIAAPLDEAGMLSAEALIAQLEGSHFPSKARRSADNAKLFLALAAKDTAAHDLAAASLEGMYESWSDSDRGDKPAADEDYARVVIAYLGHDDALLNGRALQAATHLLRQDHEATIAAVIPLAAKSDAHRYAVLEALSQVKDWGKREDIADVFLASLDAEPHCASQALFRLETKAYGFVHKEAAAEKAKGLLAHADPGVRGRAAIAWANLEADKAKVATGLEPLLADEHPFVRSAAAKAAGTARAASLLPKLVALTDDGEKNTYDLTGWTDLEGKEGRVHHDGSPWSKVGDAACRGIQAMSGAKGTPRLELSKVRHDHVDEDLATNAVEAKAWAEANGAKLMDS